MPAEWFVRQSGKTYGPIDSLRLRKLALTGRLHRDSAVSRELDGTWVRADQITGLFDGRSQHHAEGHGPTKQDHADTGKGGVRASLAKPVLPTIDWPKCPPAGSKWYFRSMGSDDSDSQGPFGLKKMVALIGSEKIRASTLVRREGEETWETAFNAGLFWTESAHEQAERSFGLPRGFQAFDTDARTAKFDRWPWGIYLAFAGVGVWLLFQSLPSDDRYSTAVERVGALMCGLGVLIYVARRGGRQARGGPNVETVAAYNTRIAKVKQSWIARTLNGLAEKLLCRWLGRPETPQRRLAVVLMPVVLGLGVISFMATNDPGRDMSQLDSDRITYLTPGDVRRLPTRGLGSYWSFARVKRISAEVASALGEETRNLGLYLPGVETLSDAALLQLAQRPGNLALDGLTRLTDEQAAILAKHEHGFVSLGGVSQLSDKSAERLARLEYHLSLYGLKDISDEGLHVLRQAGARLPKTLTYSTQRQPAHSPIKEP